MSGTDWDTIIKQGKDDPLMRTESDVGLWQRWKQTFEMAHLGGSHIFEIFASPRNPGFVYVIQQGEADIYKIGWTADADIGRRLAGLQTASPEKLSVVGSFTGSSRQTEATLHRLLAQHRQRGEWYRLTGDQVKQVLDEQWRCEQQIF